MAKLADAPDLGSGAARRVGSTPIIRTKGQSGCGFECEGGKYPHTQTQTHSVFLGVSSSTNAILWPFLHMLQSPTGSHTFFIIRWVPSKSN